MTAAAKYLGEGLKVVPVEPSTKSPKIKDWPQHAANDAFTAEDFAGMNVGVVLGRVSGDLVDIDLDSAAAVALAPAFLPPTLTFGRASKRGSHWLYKAPGVRSAMYFFPVDGGRELVEIRSTNASSDLCGHQSVFPGSTHESGEAVEWDEGCTHDEPQHVPGAELVWAVCRLTVASIILNSYEAGKGRNAQTLGYAGGLLKSGWTADEVRDAFTAIREASGDDRAKDADAVERVIAAFENGIDVQGFGSLKKDGVVPEHVVDAVERHAKTPEKRLREVKMATTGAGAGIRRAMIAEARAVDAGAQAADLVAGFCTQASANDSPCVNDPANDDGDPWALLGARVDFSAEAEPLAYLVEGLPFAPGGKVNALAGPPKGGKSPFALLLAICVAGGLAFLGRKILQPGPVLYLDAETGRLAHIRYRRICRATGVDPLALPLVFRNVEARFSPEYLTTLQGLLEAEPFRLVVVDTYGAMLEGGIDYNSPDFAHYLKELGLLSRRLDVVILVLIHEKKSGGRPGSGLEMISGSFAAAGAMQGVVSLRPEGEGNDSPIVVSCSRAPEDDFRPFRMRWLDVADPSATSPGAKLATDGKRWGLAVELVEGEPVAVAGPKAGQDEDVIRRVVEFLAGGPGPMRKIRDAVAASLAADKKAGVGKDRLERLVGLLVERGIVSATVMSTSKADVTWYTLREAA